MTTTKQVKQNVTLKFKTEWSEQDFKTMEKAIVRHFWMKTLNTHRGEFLGESFDKLDNILGLAYTSSGVHACYSICNVELHFNEDFDYQFFIMSEDGVPFAELWDKDENEVYVPLIPVETIDVKALEWFDKVNGNSYFAGSVCVNYGKDSAFTMFMPFQYGYGSQYTQEAAEVLEHNGFMPFREHYSNTGGATVLWRYCEDHKITLRSDKQENCLKRDLKRIGGK